MSVESYDDLSGWPIITDDEINTLADNIPYEDEDSVFYTSSEDPTEIAYSETDQEYLRKGSGEALEMCGVSEWHTVLNLGAPGGAKNHLSQWIAENGPKELGAKVVNKSVNDYESVVEADEDPNVVISLPRAALNTGEEIQADYGDIEDIFPNMELGVFGGESLTEPIRQKLKDVWGFDKIKETYASTETGMAAVENENGDLVPSNDNIYLEILEEGAEIDNGEREDGRKGKVPEEKIHPVEDLEEPVTGSLLVSAPGRERLPLIRYRMGDIFTASPGENGPILEYESREREVIGDLINMSGHHMYKSDIEKAVRNVSDDADWRSVVSEPSDYTELDIYVFGDEESEQNAVVEELFEVNETIGTWNEKGGMELRQHSLDTLDELEPELGEFELDEGVRENLLDPKKKTKRLAFADSYESR